MPPCASRDVGATFGFVVTGHGVGATVSIFTSGTDTSLATGFDMSPLAACDLTLTMVAADCWCVSGSISGTISGISAIAP